ncbi:MAG: hypothetical protein GC161_15665 [Planctomycetaceae bacterium]|nr:hypothetical protein [Planctomycetaceae bacterium]
MAVIVLTPEGLVKVSERQRTNDDIQLFLLRPYSLDALRLRKSKRGWTDSFAGCLMRTCAVSRLDQHESIPARLHDGLLSADWKHEVLERISAADLVCYLFHATKPPLEHPFRCRWAYGLPLVDFLTAVPIETRNIDWEFLLAGEIGALGKSVLLIPRTSEVPFDVRTPAINAALKGVAERIFGEDNRDPLTADLFGSGALMKVGSRRLARVAADPSELLALRGELAVPEPDLLAMLFALASPAMFQFEDDLYLLLDAEPTLSPENAARFVATRIRLGSDPDLRAKLAQEAVLNLAVEARIAPRIELRHKIWGRLLHYLWSGDWGEGYDKQQWSAIASALTQSDEAVYGVSSEDAQSIDRAHTALMSIRARIVGDDAFTAQRFDLLASFLRGRARFERSEALD